MKKHFFYFLLFLVSIPSFSQVLKDSLADDILEINDSIVQKTVLLEEVVVYKQKLSAEDRKQFLMLQNRVYKVYPFAKTAAERLTSLNNTMNKLENKREKKKYFKIVEEYINNEFKEKLKKLSRKQGQILIKLIHRQTGFTTFELIKNYKSGWKAFWSNNAASLFDLDLKEKYNPAAVNEDYLIETILYRAFSKGRLVEQKPFSEIDLDELDAIWAQKAAELKSQKTTKI